MSCKASWAKSLRLTAYLLRQLHTHAHTRTHVRKHTRSHGNTHVYTHARTRTQFPHFSPWHVRLSGDRDRCGGQEQTNPPTVLVQVYSQPPWFCTHSSISVWKKEKDKCDKMRETKKIYLTTKWEKYRQQQCSLRMQIQTFKCMMGIVDGQKNWESLADTETNKQTNKSEGRTKLRDCVGKLIHYHHYYLSKKRRRYSVGTPDDNCSSRSPEGCCISAGTHRSQGDTRRHLYINFSNCRFTFHSWRFILYYYCKIIVSGLAGVTATSDRSFVPGLFCLRQLFTGSFIASLPSVIFRGYSIQFNCYILNIVIFRGYRLLSTQAK